MDTRPETEKPEQPKPESGLSPQGICAIQGQPETKDTKPPTVPEEQNFQDAQGHDLAIRTYQNGDNYMVRAYDREKTPNTPDRPSFGDAGRANLHLERNSNGQVERARLQDIDTTPGYREAGVGSQMLGQCEEIARRNGAKEIYGVPENEEARNWFVRRGYETRKDGGEISKRF